MMEATFVCFGSLVVYACVVTYVSSQQLARDASRTWFHLGVVGSVCWLLISILAGFTTYQTYLSSASSRAPDPAGTSIMWLLSGMLILWVPTGLSRCWVPPEHDVPAPAEAAVPVPGDGAPPDHASRLDALRFWACTLGGGLLGLTLGAGAGIGLTMCLVPASGPDDIAGGVRALMILIVFGPIGALGGLVIGILFGFRAGRARVRAARRDYRPPREQARGFPVVPIDVPTPERHA